MQTSFKLIIKAPFIIYSWNFPAKEITMDQITIIHYSPQTNETRSKAARHWTRKLIKLYEATKNWSRKIIHVVY